MMMQSWVSLSGWSINESEVNLRSLSHSQSQTVIGSSCVISRGGRGGRGGGKGSRISSGQHQFSAVTHCFLGSIEAASEAGPSEYLSEPMFLPDLRETAAVPPIRARSLGPDDIKLFEMDQGYLAPLAPKDFAFEFQIFLGMFFHLTEIDPRIFCAE